MRHDIISDVFSIIKNAESIGKRSCIVPASRVIKDILTILHEHNYIGDFKYIEDGKGGKFRVKLIGRINKCGSIRPRFSVSVDDLIRWEKKYLPASGIGILIVTTSKGIMDQNQVRKEKTGGKLLGYVY